jgi:hypothetical protein
MSENEDMSTGGDGYSGWPRPGPTGNVPLTDVQAGVVERHFGAAPDMVNRPSHYTQHPSGVECIQVTEHMGFCLGNAMKYIWRADLKNDAIEDLRKARFYLDREIARREGGG